MAKTSVTKEVSRGTCHFCKGEFDKGKMTQHLKYCKQRMANLKAETSAGAEKLQTDLADLPPAEIEARVTELMTARLQSESGAPLSPEEQSLVAMAARFLQPGLLFELASGAFDEQDMDIELGKVLKVGRKFSHEYDFGSTTELTLRVVGEREGVVAEDEDGDPLAVLVMARNEPPVIPCKVCGEPATKIAPGYFYAADGAYCDACAKKSDEYDDEMLPVVNSPRTGVCGYTGRD